MSPWYSFIRSCDRKRSIKPLTFVEPMLPLLYCSIKSPKDFIIFSTSSQKPLRLILEDIEEIKDTPSRVFKIGTSQLTDTYETIWPAVTTNMWYEVADMVCPDAIITPEITGTTARVNFAAL